VNSLGVFEYAETFSLMHGLLSAIGELKCGKPEAVQKLETQFEVY